MTEEQLGDQDDTRHRTLDDCINELEPNSVVVRQIYMAAESRYGTQPRESWLRSMRDAYEAQIRVPASHFIREHREQLLRDLRIVRRLIRMECMYPNALYAYFVKGEKPAAA